MLYFTSTLEQLNSLSFVLNKILKILFWFEKQVSFLTSHEYILSAAATGQATELS